MKNFFKKLAFVLALALVVTAIAPAGKASAAAKPALVKSGKVLYIGGDKTGTIGDTYRFTFNNAAGYKATWKSSNKAVATVDAKSGNIQAVAVGTTTITATLSKAGKATELVAKVWVKQNTDKVVLGSLDKVKNPLAVGDTAKVNVARQVGTTKVWKQTDKTLSTDSIVWESSDPAVATVDKWGKVTAVAAGKATITASAVQSEGKTVVDKANYEVTVQAGLTAVAQQSINTIGATFAGDLSAVANATNVKVSYMEGTTKINVVVKEVKFDATDKKKAVITTYTDILKDKEYVVEYATTTASFKGADLSKAKVASIKITTTEAVKNTATDVKVVAYDANGVVVPESAYNATDITLETVANSDFYLDATAKKITFFNSGKSATITAKFHTYTFGTDFKEITIDAQGVIASKDAASITAKTVDTFTVYKNSGAVDFTKPSSTIAVSDNATYNVAVKITKSDDKTANSVDNAADFTFESSDTTKLLVQGSTLCPIKEGGAVVIVKYNKAVVGAYPVTIGAKRVASDVVLTPDKTTLSKSNASDSIKLTVEVKDQYGAAFSGDITPGLVNGAATVAAPAAQTGNKVVFTFPGVNYATEGTYQYKVTVGDQTRYFTFTVKDAGTDVSSYQLSNAGKSVDTALKVGNTNNTDSKAFKLELSSLAVTGYKIANIALTHTTKTDAYTSLNATTGSAFYVEVVAPTGKSAADINPFVKVNGGAVEVNPVVASGSFIKAPAGIYTVKVFKLDKATTTTTENNCVVTPVTVANFTITDTQIAGVPTVNKTTSAYTTALAALQDKADVVTIKIDGKEYNANVVAVTQIGTVTATDKTVAVTKAQVAVDVKYDNQVGTFLQDVTVDATITLK